MRWAAVHGRLVAVGLLLLLVTVQVRLGALDVLHQPPRKLARSAFGADQGQTSTSRGRTVHRSGLARTTTPSWA